MVVDADGSFYEGGQVGGYGDDRITGGCNLSPLQYCPQSYVTRGQMAVFIERAMGLAGELPAAAKQ